MAFDRIIKTAVPRLLAFAPAFALAALSFAPIPARAASAGVQTCTVVLFAEVCTGAVPVPAPMLGGSMLSLTVLGGFVALRRRAATRDMGETGVDRPVIED